MSDPFTGELRLFGFNFAPRGWAECNGQILSISSNSALFSLLGTTYGGDGQTTFALPDLRGRANVHKGTGPGLSARPIGQRGGLQTVQLTAQEMPAHNHKYTPQANSGSGNNPDPSGNYPSNATASLIYSNSQNANMGESTTANAGGGSAHENMPPYLVLNWCIALTGVFPSRN